MTDATTEFFEELGRGGHVPLLEKATGTLRFDLRSDKRITRWLVTIDKGDVTVSHKNAKANCVVRAEESLFDGLASGRENAMAAVLRGAVDLEGDQALLLPFQRLFPGPPRRGS
jgi:putative sterol carrier protein